MENNTKVFEIFLSKLADEEELFTEITDKLAFGESYSKNFSGLAEYLCASTSPIKLMLYISDEEIENEIINDILETVDRAEKDNALISSEVIEDEFLNLIDNSGGITKAIKPRSLVHRDGDLHPTVHIWIIKRKDMGIYTLLQKRADTKAVHPGCYDASAAGHITQRADYRNTAVKEVSEELGITIAPEKLQYVGTEYNSHVTEATGERIIDNEFCVVYLYNETINIDDLVLQESEVSEVCWAEIDELLSVMDRGLFKHCIFADELSMIKKAMF